MAEGGYMLRVSGRTALGPSGTGGRDGKQYATANDLYRDLASFGLGQDITAAAAQALLNPEIRKRFVNFADDVQIPFDKLERADLYLFDGVE